MIWGSGALVGQKEQNVEFKVMSPEIGVPFVTEQTMILKHSKKQAIAKGIHQLIRSNDDPKLEYSQKFGSIPANKDALKNYQKQLRNLLTNPKPQDINWGSC